MASSRANVDDIFALIFDRTQYWRRSVSRQGRHVQWELVPREEESGTFVAWVASAEGTKRMKPTDKAIFGMASESPGRNASEPSGGLEKI
jgi:hypothetical protein